MNITRNKKLTKNAQSLRKNMTKEERKLWYECLKTLPVTFNRQKVIGDYIVDFYCASAKLVIELDGSQHYKDIGKEQDTIRDAYLSKLGLTVLRYANSDIHQRFDAVCEDILQHLNASESLPLEGKVAPHAKRGVCRSPYRLASAAERSAVTDEVSLHPNKKDRGLASVFFIGISPSVPQTAP